VEQLDESWKQGWILNSDRCESELGTGSVGTVSILNSCDLQLWWSGVRFLSAAPC
jgi:hypothetical protein